MKKSFLLQAPAFLLLQILFSFSLCLPFSTCYSQDDCMPAKPSPERLVNNFSIEFQNFISPSENEALENKLSQFSKETSNQVAIVITDDFCGFDANEFGTRLFNSWKIGQEKYSNGILIVVKPSGGEGQRDVFIITGYGLEGVVPDITCKQIVENEIIPRFINGDNYGALDAATSILISLAKKEYSYSDYQKRDSENWTPFIIAFCIIALYIFISFRKKGYTVTSGGRRTYYGGGWTNWGGGGGWSGGGGSGGFGGFGGGMSGGGGAGGKW